MKNILEFETIKKFIDKAGKGIDKYFGKSKGALVYLEPNGIWYAEGLYEWLTKEKKKDITISTMEDDGSGLDESKVRGRKAAELGGEENFYYHGRSANTAQNHSTKVLVHLINPSFS